MENIINSSKPPNDNEKEPIYSTSSMKQYWCHLCKTEFTKLYIPNIDIQCTHCGNTFCEELDKNIKINSESHPIHFEPYTMRNNINNGQNGLLNHILIVQGVSQPRSSVGLLDLIINFANSQNYTRNIESIINQIMMKIIINMGILQLPKNQ